MRNAKKRLIIGISGASGLPYGVRLLEVLRKLPDYEIHLVMSNTAKLNVRIETDMELADIENLADVVHSNKNLAASISSGSFRTEGMIIAPCSMRTLSAIVNSNADSLLTRAADVVLKERRCLVALPRETPLHVGHCRLLHEASLMGVILFPPVPAFYSRPRTIDDILNATVGRVLDLFGLDPGIVKRWQGVNSTSAGDGAE